MSADSVPLGLGRGTVRLVDFDRRWADLFATEASRVAQAIQGAGLPPVRLEHVGSTAIPGLVAKPILDILAGTSPGVAWPPYLEALVTLGYEPRGPQGVAGRELLVLGPEQARTHHLNLVMAGDVFWRDHLAFRDRLRADPVLAEAYATLKRDLASKHANDREAYTAGKAAFVDEVLQAVTRAPGGAP